MMPQLSESVSSALDEIVYERNSCNSDPIGREHDLSSSGPLDEGIEPRACPLRVPQTEQVNRVKSYPTRYHHSATGFETPSRVATQNGYTGLSADDQRPGHAPGSSPIASPIVAATYDHGSPLKDKSVRMTNGRSASAAHPSNASNWRSNIQGSPDSRREERPPCIGENSTASTVCKKAELLVNCQLIISAL
jgi:hypothetical protein